MMLSDKTIQIHAYDKKPYKLGANFVNMGAFFMKRIPFNLDQIQIYKSGQYAMKIIHFTWNFKPQIYSLVVASSSMLNLSALSSITCKLSSGVMLLSVKVIVLSLSSAGSWGECPAPLTSFLLCSSETCLM